MRLWTLHPHHLDTKGLVALWREGLLARAVLAGQTRGYTNHPQLERFRAGKVTAVNEYLHVVCDEADRRGYDFRREKLGVRFTPKTPPLGSIPVTSGQVAFELEHLSKKLETRTGAPLVLDGSVPVCHPMFFVVDGPVEGWERV